MHRERLQKAIDTLKALRPIIKANKKMHFNLDNWSEESTKCGTTACAVGWLASSPWFTRRGLSLEFDSIDELSNHKLFQPVYKYRHRTVHGYVAVAHFFNINFDDTIYFFDPSKYFSSYSSLRLLDQVVIRIERYLRENP